MSGQQAPAPVVFVTEQGGVRVAEFALEALALLRDVVRGAVREAFQEAASGPLKPVTWDDGIYRKLAVSRRSGPVADERAG